MIKENSKNKFLGGKLTILQQREGFRAGHDSVLLASSIPAKKGDKCLELGIGAGVVSLCLMKRVPGLSVIGIDNDRDIIKLLKENISLNGF
jgi:tRNA1Val (adenine37-N6)-methyltransferase